MTQRTGAPVGPGGVFLLFTVAGLFYTWPLALHLTDGIPFGYRPDPAYALSTLYIGDHLQAFYHLSLLKKAVLGQLPWFADALEFATDLHRPVTTTYLLPLSALALPFAFVSDELAYNVLVLASFGLSGLACWLWVTNLTGDRTAGFVGAALFDFIPLRLSELYGGHPAGFSLFLFPLALYLFDRAVERSSWRYALGAGLAILAFRYQYIYFTYYLLLFLLVYIPWRFVPAAATALGQRRLTTLLVAGIPFALGLMAAVYSMAAYKSGVVAKSAFAAGRGLDEVALYSPKLAAFLHPGDVYAVYLGVASLMALGGIVAWGGALFRPGGRGAQIGFFLTVFVVAYVLAFGATLDPYGGLYSFFYDHVPAFKFSRVPHKIMVIAVTALAALAGYFALWLKERSSPGVARAILSLFVAALVFDTHPRQAVGICKTDPHNPVYTTLWMEAAPGEKVVEVPLWPGDTAWTSLYQYYALQSGVPMVNGYLPTVDPNYVEKFFGPLFSLNAGEVTGAQRAFLQEQKVGWLIFHEEAYPPKVMAFPAPLARRRLLQSPSLHYRGRADRIFLFTVNPVGGELSVDDLAVSPTGLYFESESLPNIEGKRVDDPTAGNGAALRGAKGVEGTLNAGPYKNFPPGRYVATFRARRGAGAPLDKPLLTFDVAADQGRRIVAAVTLTGGELGVEYTDIALPFTLEPGSPWKVEFRAVASGMAETFVDSVYVTFAALPDPVTAFEAEELTSIGALTEDPDALSGMAVGLRPDRDPAGVVLSGPVRRYDAGARELRFRYRAEREGAAVILSSVLTGGDVARLDLPPTGGVYATATAPFTLARPDILDLVVRWDGKGAVRLDQFAIVPEGETP